MRNAVAAGEAMLARVRADLFSSLLARPVAFFDRHKAGSLAGLVVAEVDSMRMCLLTNVARDRGLRALLEAIGSVVILALMSWRLGPVLAGKKRVW